MLASEKRFFHWELEFPEAFAGKENPGFDVVIGNPPYVRPHKLPAEIKQFLWQKFPGYAAKSDILNCFLEIGLALIGQGKRLGMITSDTWRILDSSKKLRYLLLEQSMVNLIRQLPNGVFSDATVKPVIVVLEKESDVQERRGNMVRVLDIHDKTIICPQINWIDSDDYLFDVADSITVCIKGKIEQVSIRLGETFIVDFGLKTADDELFVCTENKNSECKKLIASKSIRRYSHEWHGDYVWYRLDLMRSHHQTARPGEPERFEREKVLLSRMAERLTASLDRERLYVKDALLIALPRQGISLTYLLSAMNSQLINFWYVSTFTTVDTHRNEVMKLPIRRCAHFIKADYFISCDNRLVSQSKKLVHYNISLLS
jgi:hypothetical protein